MQAISSSDHKKEKKSRKTPHLRIPDSGKAAPGQAVNYEAAGKSVHPYLYARNPP